MILFDAYISHVCAVNNSKTVAEHAENQLYLMAWINGVRAAGIKINGHDADMYFIERSIDRPMCCGVFLDWEPTQ